MQIKYHLNSLFILSLFKACLHIGYFYLALTTNISGNKMGYIKHLLTEFAVTPLWKKELLLDHFDFLHLLCFHEVIFCL